MLDKVLIEDLAIEAVVGIYAWERKVPQLILISMELAHDNSIPARTQKIEDTLDYKEIADRVTAFVVEKKFELLETMAEKVASLVMQEFSVAWLKLSCKKPTVMSQARSVGVCIERGKK